MKEQHYYFNDPFFITMVAIASIVLIFVVLQGIPKHKMTIWKFLLHYFAWIICICVLMAIFLWLFIDSSDPVEMMKKYE